MLEYLDPEVLEGIGLKVGTTGKVRLFQTKVALPEGRVLYKVKLDTVKAIIHPCPELAEWIMGRSVIPTKGDGHPFITAWVKVEKGGVSVYRFGYHDFERKVHHLLEAKEPFYETLPFRPGRIDVRYIPTYTTWLTERPVWLEDKAYSTDRKGFHIDVYEWLLEKPVPGAVRVEHCPGGVPSPIVDLGNLYEYKAYDDVLTYFLKRETILDRLP